jgi:O-antigen/teichoic acid export membrane protein
MRLDRNLIAGVAQSIWSAVLALAVVPLYLKYLGMEAYGLIAFFTSAQSLLQLLDMGLVPTMNREVARCSAQQDYEPARALLHSLSVVYWITAAVIALAIALLAPLVSHHWLQARSMPQQSVDNTVILMGLVIACRWPIGIYQGAIMGAQRLLVSSLINVAMVTIGSVGSVALLALVSPRIEVFFVWQGLVGIAYALTMRWAAWNVLGEAKLSTFDWQALRRIWRFSAGMSGVAFSGIILMQLDKILLSRILSLEAFGSYALAATLSTGLYVLLTPTFNVIYPRLSAMVAVGDTSRLKSFYRVGTRLLLAFLFPLAAFVSVYSRDILLIWTHNPAIASNAAPIVSIFIVGTALNGAMHFPYALQLAYGTTRIPLNINAILLILTVPTTIILAYRFGAIGGAISWAIINALYLVIGTRITHKSLLTGIAWKWIVSDVGIPLVISILIVGGLDSQRYVQSDHIALSLATGALTCILATVLIACTSTPARLVVWQLARAQTAKMRKPDDRRRGR